MKFINNILNTLEFIVNHINSIKDFMIKTDDEYLAELLKNPIDRKIFEETVDELEKGNIKFKEIELNNKKIKVSIL